MSDRVLSYAYWQFWRNTDDADVPRFLKLFTDLPLDEIAKLEALSGSEINEAKKVLATEATRLLHGDSSAAEATETARLAFEKGAASNTLPGVDVALADLEDGIPAFRLFAMAGLARSNSEARRLIRGGGARINDVHVKEEDQRVTLADLHDGAIKLSSGRKHHRLVRVG